MGSARWPNVLGPTALWLFIGTVAVVQSADSDDVKALESRRDLEHPMWELKYVITIDAGSTGSRVHINPYAIRGGKGSVPSVQPSQTLKLTPGLSSFENTPQDAAQNIHQLMHFARKQIPMSQWRLTPVFLKATAGLRSIPEPAANAVLTVCRAVLHEYDFIFRDEWAEVIPGRDEGKYGWVAANYLEGTFHSDRPSRGVIEMGGASMQVSFVPENPRAPEVDQDKLVRVEVGDKHYMLYTYSYLNYGLQAAHAAYLESVKQGGSVDPCMNSGHSVGAPSGSGDFDACLTAVKQLFPKGDCKAKACSFNGVYQPVIAGESFLAIVNFFFTARFFGVDTFPKEQLYTKLKEKGREFCATPWAEAESKHAGERDLAKFCFAAAYEHTVLTLGLGIADPSKNVVVQNSILGVDIDWVLGAVFSAVTDPSVRKLVDEAESQSLSVDLPGALPCNRAVSEEQADSSSWSSQCYGMIQTAQVVMLIVFVAVASYLARCACEPATKERGAEQDDIELAAVVSKSSKSTPRSSVRKNGVV